MFYKIAAAALLSLALSTPSFAAFVTIDEFTVNQAFLIENVTGNTDSSTAGGAAETTILGGFRDLVIRKDAGTSFVVGEVTGGQLLLSSNAGTSGTFEVTWDGATVNNQIGTAGVTTNGLGGIDLVAGINTGILLDTFGDPNGYLITMRVWDMDGDFAELSRDFATGGGDDTFFTFDQFLLENAALDFTNIGAVQLSATGDPSSDLVANIVLARNQIPAPGALLLMSLGLLGFGFVRAKGRA